jgi:hypothetical protein
VLSQGGVTELLSPFSKCNPISVNESQRGGFSKEGRERFPSKGSTLALKGFLTQSSSSAEWQGLKEEDKITKQEMQVQLRHHKKNKMTEFHKVLLPEEIMKMQMSILIFILAMLMTTMIMLIVLRTIAVTLL